MATGAADARVWMWAVGAALVVHVGAVGALSRVKVAWEPPPAPPVEFELRQPLPPAPSVERPEPPPPPAAVEPPKARVVPRRLAVAEAPPPTAPPAPNREPPPEAPKNAPPVFGVTMSSVVSGDSAAPAVPVGNTLMVKPAGPRPTDKPAEAYAGGPPQAFRPVPDVYIATAAKALYKVEGDEVYPTDARAVGLEGSVKLSVDLNEKGVVVGVKVLERAGHGFDEAAVKAMRQFRYRPAMASDGRPVPCRFAYMFRFSISD